MVRRAAWALLALACLAQSQASSPPPRRELQAMIDAMAPGGTLRLAAGEYRGPARIAKPLILDGGGVARLSAGGQGSVLEVSGHGVTVRGLTIAGSGESHDAMDAGLVVEGRDHRIEDNQLDDVLYGIHLRRASGTTVRGNRVRGKPMDLGLRGDALRVWNGSGNLIADNYFERSRDLSFANAPDNRLIDNRFEDGRYGLHVVFSPRLVVERNWLSRLGTGIVVLYSADLSLRDNRVEHALGGAGVGILFKDSGAARVEGNEVLRCAVGLKVDTPPEPSGVLEVRGNRFAHNLSGLFFYGEGGGHRFSGNRFEHNLLTVGLSGPGAGATNHWEANYWDDYAGFDRDADGLGDRPHEIWLYADRIWMETPAATFFRNSPALELLDFLERLAPFAAPYRALRDAAPRMH